MFINIFSTYMVSEEFYYKVEGLNLMASLPLHYELLWLIRNYPYSLYVDHPVDILINQTTGTFPLILLR